MYTSKFPLSVDGERLDTMCWNVSTQSSRRRLSSKRPRDVQIAGRHGVVPSTYDDFEAGQLALQMWVRGSDSDGVGNDRMLYDKNMDRLFRIFGRNDGLIDIRQVMDPDRQTTQYNFTRNPRLSNSTGNTVLRTNYVPNPSMEKTISVVPFRTNLVINPAMRTSITGWVQAHAGVNLVWWPYGIGGVGRVTLTAPGTESVYSTPFAVTAGLPYAAQVAMRNIDSVVRGRTGLVWYDAANGTGNIISIDYGPEEDLAFLTGWTRVEYVATAPVGAVSARLLVNSNVTFFPNARFDFYQAIVEQATYVSDYFDGDSKPEMWRYGYRWTGTAHASTSQKYYKPLQNWSAAPATGLVANMADQPGSFVWTSTVLRAEMLDDINSGTLIINQTGRPTTTAGQPWSGRISLRGVSGVSVGKVIKIGIYAADSGGANMGPILTVEHTLTDGWREVVIDGAIAPTGVASVGWKAESLDEWQAGQYFFVDAASLENVSKSGPFFAGGMNNVRWSDSANPNASNSQELGGNIANWTPIRGTLSKSYDPLYTPVPFGTPGLGKYTATDVSVTNGNQITMDYANFSDNPELKLGIPYTASVHVTGPGRAKVQLVVANSSNTSLWSSDSDLVEIVDGWTRIHITDTPPTSLVGAAKIRMTVYFYGPSAQPGANDEFFATAAQLELGELGDWFDGNFPGATWDGLYSRFLPAVRQNWGKVTDAVDTSMFAEHGADIGVAITLPYVFWSDTDDLVWYSDPVGGTGTTVKYEVSNLRGSTAPIDDAIIIVNGPATNPRVQCPKTGGYIQYNGVLTSTQAWRIDVGHYLSGTGPKTLDWDSPVWTDQMKRTYYTGSRNRLLTLVPEGAEGEVYLSFSNCDSAKVRARRKFH